jgi:hypothetical protein
MILEDRWGTLDAVDQEIDHLSQTLSSLPSVVFMSQDMHLISELYAHYSEETEAMKHALMQSQERSPQILAAPLHPSRQNQKGTKLTPVKQKGGNG